MTNDTKRGGSGNFANDPQRASEEGKKGGHANQGGQHDQSGGGRQGQQGSNFANDPQKASEAGRKGGEASHGGHKK